MKWISVEERLPEPLVWVLVYLGLGSVEADMYQGGKHWVRYPLDITHWMPLPAPPTEEA